MPPNLQTLPRKAKKMVGAASKVWEAKSKSKNKTLLRLCVDVLKYAMSYLSGNEIVSLMYDCCRMKDKFLFLHLFAELDLLNTQKEDKDITLLMHILAQETLKVPEAMINFLLRFSALDIDMTEKTCHRSALIFAIQNSHTSVALSLIKSGADVDLCERMMSNSPLILAAERGYGDIIEALIDADCDLNIRDETGHTALLYAAEKGFTCCAVRLIESGADLNFQTKNGYTALTWPVRQGYTDIAVSLIKAGADVHCVNIHGYTALRWAAEKGFTDIAVSLISSGADMDIRDNRGSTALIMASQQGYPKIALPLIEASCDLDIVDENGYSALIWAVQEGHIEIALALIEAKCDLNIQEKVLGFTALLYCAENGYFDLATVLIKSGATLDTQSKVREKSSPIIWAKGYTDIALSVMNASTRMKSQGIKRNARFMALADATDTEEVTKSVESPPSQNDHGGSTALIMAVCRGNIDIAISLIHAGADTGLTNHAGKDVLSYCTSETHAAIAAAINLQTYCVN